VLASQVIPLGSQLIRFHDALLGGHGCRRIPGPRGSQNDSDLGEDMKRNALKKINESSPVQMIPCWQQTRTYLTGSVLCNPSQDMRVCQTWTSSSANRTRCYVESTKVNRLAIIKLGHLPARIYCLHIKLEVALSVLPAN